MLIWSCLIARIRLGWLKLLHPIKEGIFLRHPKDKDYKYWCLRNYARLFPGWLAATVPFPWLKTFCNYTLMGQKVGKRCLLNVGWVSQELMEIGNDVKIHQTATVTSWAFEGEKLLLKKVVLEDNVIVGAKTVVYPGCILKKGVVISGSSFVLPMTETEPGCTYFGTPIKLIRRDTDYFKDKEE
jgi:serine acetyltransferase